MQENIQEKIIQLIRESLKGLGIDNTLPEDLRLDFPQDSRFGDLSTNIAMRSSKLLKKPPREAALNLTALINSGLKESCLKDYIKEVKVEGAGFINFYFSDKYLYRELQAILKGGKEALRLDKGQGKPVLIEFVSANPTGSLSVAHGRQAAVGDAFANILDFLGFKVKREYYLNDEGNQINILGKSVGLRIRELGGEKVDFPQNYYQGEYIYDIAKEAKQKGIEADNLGDFAADYILAIIRQELDDFGVKFDYWYSQKELGKSGKIEHAFELLKKKGFLYTQEGALWFKSTVFGDDKDRVVVKSDGAYTYLAPDIAYHDDKYKRGFKWLINLWGPDHHGYINRLKASIAAFGRDPASLSILIVQLATIFRDGRSVQMSTRHGEYITLREVLDEVGKDAARFFFMARRISSHLDFDLDIAKKQTSENPVYYIQYAHARIYSILRNSAVKLNKNAGLSLLKEKEELALIKKLLQFSYILTVCLNTQDPYMLTVYLQELSEAFHKFYDSHRVLSDNEPLTSARLSLIEGVKIVIAVGLDLLGVSKPEKM
ncbi:MAG: arginine--tRNA ligase [Candidatus Omnitrophica bacterium CG08_land_8_20_14_0_20_41_16]|uniref:Arginine--tRNA ligase n=1 Tax=Candidatus Sherwoodlollariibacterium unditelluris TaxID=1974757 RepID=A0A2G9YJB5_9BACT|nr:MAG: arginine--tRNA ligase [Candidatus Omnitrophica bacterium CG23_combo_of_CG06-09_8_20_14_all_41_10]PIS34349.1 MAG: arginine--tRNA ligase [Candidatus Omnitrophica bacterium CG08_land_8_20_14_0_20_41_16]